MRNVDLSAEADDDDHSVNVVISQFIENVKTLHRVQKRDVCENVKCDEQFLCLSDEYDTD